MIKAKDLEFSQEIGNYFVLRLEIKDYKGTKRILPADAEIANPDIKNKIRKDEKRLLKSYFRMWKSPYYGRLPGWRDDSPVYIIYEGRLVCGVYVCDKNEFNTDPDWGQVHYAFIEPRYQGNGFYSIVFQEVVKRAKTWGMKGLYLNSDRHLLPEMYERWGAVRWKIIPKLIEFSENPNRRTYNWLVDRIHNEMLTRRLIKYASGNLLDIGCCEKPYQSVTKGLVTKHIGLDHPGSIHSNKQLDIFATAYKTALADNSVDTILCTEVLEHLEDPQDAIKEMFRILRPGGYVITSTPLFWHLHEEPRDFYRYTKHRLDYLFTTARFKIVEIKPLSGFIVTFSQELIYFLRRLMRGFLTYLLIPVQIFIQLFAYWLNRWDRSHGFTWAYLVVAQKPVLN